jgi:hypothetical protein
MTDLTQQVLAELDASGIGAIAAQLGVNPAQAQAAIEQAVPLLVGGLARNASTDAGAGSLHRAVSDHAGMDIGSILGSVLGGGGGGGSILGHVLGNRQDQASQNLGQASGLGSQNAGQLLAMLAPIIMGVLGNMSRNRGMDAGGLGGMLGQQRQQIDRSGNGGLLSSVLDQDGDGQLGLGDLLKVGADLLGSRGRA